MEAEPEKKKKGKGKAGAKKKTKKQIQPNPDEVVDIDRPGSANSQRSNVDLFSTEVAEKADEKDEKPEEAQRPGTATSLAKPGPSTSRTNSPSLPFKPPSQVAPALEGSQSSLRSREAWAGEDPKKPNPTTSRRPASASSTRSATKRPEITSAPVRTDTHAAEPDQGTSTPRASEDTKSVKSGSGTSTDLMSAPKMKGEEQAYIPYKFARDTVARIANDMHKMKGNHVSIINQIEVNYKMIEDQTQRQFNAFVLNLRSVYKDKLTIFQHVINIHLKDTEKKKEHWNGNLSSLSKQNKKLLGDKKALLIQNKLLLDRMGAVREEATHELSLKIDELNAKLSQETKDHKEELDRLRSQPERPMIVPVVAPTRTRVSAVEPEEPQQSGSGVIEVTKEVIVDMSEKERAELSAERQRMTEEMTLLSKQRETLEAERSEFIEDRKRLNDEKNQLQSKITSAEKGVAEWRGKYDLTKSQLSQFGSLRSDYAKLLAAYNAVIAAGSPAQADAKIAKAKEDRKSLEEDKNGFEKDIEKWKKEHKERTGKEPTEEDQPDSIRKAHVSLNEKQGVIDKLDIEVEFIEKIKNGEAPPPPAMSKAGDSAVITAEPVIKIVEVKVPDPEVVAQLSISEEKNDKLQKENANLQIKIDSLQKDISEAKESISDLEAKLKRAEAENSGNIKTIVKLTNQLKEGIREPVDTVDAPLAAEISTGDADHTDCQERIQELEAKIERLEQQLVDGDITPAAAVTVDDSEKIESLQAQLDDLDEKLRKEQAEHKEAKDVIEELKARIKDLDEQVASSKGEQDGAVNAATVALSATLARKEKKLEAAKARVAEIEAKLLENVPVDAAKEMEKLLKIIASLTKDNDAQSKKAAEAEGKVATLEAEKSSVQKVLDKEKATNETTQAKLKAAKDEKEKELTKLAAQWDKKEKTRTAESKAKIEALNKKIKELESRPAAAVAPRGKAESGGDAKSQKQIAVLTEQLQDKKKDNKDLQAKIQQLQDDVKKAKSETSVDPKEAKKQEKILKELSKKLDMETKKAERDGAKVKELETNMVALTKDRDTKDAEVKKLKADRDQLDVAAAKALGLEDEVQQLKADLQHLDKETKRLTEAYNTERVQRKKYFNMVEDMKGKIRVYARARPMSKTETERGNFSVLKSPDEYSLNVESSRGMKEFNFDRVFMPHNSQDQVFEDTYHLIQSAVDGYNVCIFAYGQTGSGKTYTMIGGGPSNPGIAPRAFSRIFEVMEENKEKFDFKVSSYMMELYNDKLLDLYAGKDGTPDDKMDIKKDKAGLVFVKGALVKDADSVESLQKLFDDGSKNRHVASTKMNAESSRSHLVLSVIIEATNKTNGQVNRGKLSLVDLAGSERVSKTEAAAEQLKEANSINKSLAALGDVISALSSDQQFIPYRNNKLTMLMQDSLGGNAKTLMFVNISPADYNCDETITSLTYASRVKLITNDAQKNQDNKEIARLKALIAKMKEGEGVADDEVEV